VGSHKDDYRAGEHDMKKGWKTCVFSA